MSRTSTGRGAFRPHLESLECRELLAASIGVVDRVLVIDGTDLADSVRVTIHNRGTPTTTTDDRIAVALTNPTQSLNVSYDLWRVVAGYSLPLITRISFTGQGENDTFENRTGYTATASGDAGDDRLVGGDSADTLMGGPGSDTIRGGLGNDSLDGGANIDWVVASGGNFTLTNTTLFGAEGSETLTGIERARLLGSADANLLDAAAFSLGAVQLDGDAGNDTLVSGTADDTLLGGAGVDWVRATGSSVTVTNTLVTGSLTGKDETKDIEVVHLIGSSAADTLDASGATSLRLLAYGNGGGDRITGGPNNDTLYGDLGEDTLFGNGGNDSLLGGAQNDLIFGGVERDTVLGNDGNDTLYGEAGDDFLTGDAGQDVLFGGTNNDTLGGGADPDLIFGEDGADALYGGAGADTLSGGAGQDGLFGGTGVDSLTGGPGNDRFLDYTWTETETSWWFFTSSVRKWQDSIAGMATTEARLGFENGTTTTVDFAGSSGSATYAGGTWADGEVERIDSALSVLHQATANAHLLRKADGGGVIFVRQGVKTGGTSGATAWNSGGRISATDAVFSGSMDFSRAVILHEVGHNWDGEYNGATWRALSGWTTSNKKDDPNYTRGWDADTTWYYLTSAQFVSGYAKTNPNEDFAESFSSYFMDLGSYTSPLVTQSVRSIAGKKTFLDNLVADLL